MQPLTTLLLLCCWSVTMAQSDPLSVSWQEDRPVQNVLVKYEGQRLDPNYRQGTYKRYYKGNLEAKGQYFRNRKHGRWERYHVNRKVMLSGAYHDGQKTGEWRFYSATGQLRAVMHFDRGMRTGQWEGYYPDGTKASIKNYARDVEVGEQRYWHRNGKRAEIAHIEYLNDTTQVIRTQRYHPNGKIFEQAKWINEAPDSVYTSFHDNTLPWEKINYDNGKLLEIEYIYTPERVLLATGDIINGSGEARFYHQEGWLYAVEQYVKGVRNGKAKYYVDGNQRVVGHWYQNVPRGEWKYFSKYHRPVRIRTYEDALHAHEEQLLIRDGERSEGPLAYGLRHGLWTTYNFYGEATAKTNYEFGYLHGEHTRLNGVITRESGQFQYGERVGLWRYYNNQGKQTYSENHHKEVAFDPSLIDADTDPLPWKKESEWTFDPQEELTTFVEGDQAEADFIAANLVTPEVARYNDVRGEVQLQLTIDELGEVVDCQILRGIGFGCDEEAVRVVTAMPWRNPMVVAGLPQKTRVNIGVTFGMEQ